MNAVLSISPDGVAISENRRMALIARHVASDPDVPPSVTHDARSVARLVVLRVDRQHLRAALDAILEVGQQSRVREIQRV
jgi:hypothetical protein